jgi:Sec-independent protein secretion pathway component TatC
MKVPTLVPMLVLFFVSIYFFSFCGQEGAEDHNADSAV